MRSERRRWPSTCAQPTRPVQAYQVHQVQRSRQQGLTLVELLVAIGVLAFVAVLGWRGLDAITRARAALNADLEQTRGLQLAFAQLQADCANAVDTITLDGRSPLAVNADRVTIARRVQLDAQPGKLQLVTWRLRNGVLTREESPSTRDLTQLNQYWQFAAAGGAGPVTLRSGLRAMDLRVWTDDGRGWRSWTQAQSLAAPSGQSAAAPMTSRGALMNPGAGTTAMQTPWSGLEVSLQIQGNAAPMTKVFMLGAI
jgi:general secretion pathway protein J